MIAEGEGEFEEIDLGMSPAAGSETGACCTGLGVARVVSGSGTHGSVAFFPAPGLGSKSHPGNRETQEAKRVQVWREAAVAG